MKKTRLLFITLVVILIASIALTACQPAATEAPAEEAAPAEEEAPAEEAAPAEEEAPMEEGPAVGGNMVFAAVEEPDTLDIYKSAFAISSAVTTYMGGALVAKNVNGEIVPSLAKSWDVSEDGLTYTFHLRDDVKFHNGEPFTANDYVWTWDRCRAEGFVCQVSASMIASVVSYEAPDDYTLVLNLSSPNFYILGQLTIDSYLQPLNQTAVEADGDNYGLSGHNAVGVGPYMLKEWVQDEKIVLERNPDYTWGPELIPGGNTGPYYLNTIEFRFLPDLATVLAGVEAGELGYASIEAKDVQIVTDTGMYQIFDLIPTGFSYVSFNVTDPVFQDLNVRKAFNLATDKETAVQVVLQGQGLVADGPLSPAMLGYDAAAMEGSGYPYDLEEAKSLMQEAGYTYDADGMLLTPEGEPFKIVLHGTTDEQTVKTMQVLVDMWGQLGVEVEIQQLEWGTLAPLVFQGQYQATMMGIGWPDADVMHLMYHTASLGGTNFAFVEDATMDDLLSRARSETDPANQQEVVNEAFQYVIDQAYAVPLAIAKAFVAVHNDFQGVVVSPYIGVVFSDTYYVGE